MAWYNPASWSGEDWKRVGLGVVTGGQSELGNPLIDQSKKLIGVNGGAVPDALNALGVPSPQDLLTPEKIDLTPGKEAQARAFSLADALAAERAGRAPTVAPGVDRANIDPYAKQQQDAINAIAAASRGEGPSAAELQLRAEADRAAGQQFGLASALQGGLSPGAALRQAQIGSAGVLGEANQQAAILRAKEQADARNALVGALQGVRGQEQELALSNLRSRLESMGLDQRAIEALLNAQVAATGQGVSAATGIMNADALRAQSANQFKGGVNQTAGNLFTLLSDATEKTNVSDADMGEFLDALDA